MIALTRTGRLAVALLLWSVAPALAADISAETGALLSDLLKPYREGQVAAPGADAKALEAALGALKKEGLLDAPRPATGGAGLAEAYGKALALGTRTPQFVAELGAIHDALSRRNEQAARDAIRALYARASRTPPEGATLDKLYKDVRAVHSARTRGVERIEIARDDHSVLITRSADKVKVDVTAKAPGAEPTRTVFEGDVVTRADTSGKDLEPSANPAPAPRTVTPEQARELRARINGLWIDEDGNKWEVSGSGTTIALTETRAKTRHRIAYTGRFDLGRISGEHIVSDPADMEADLPLPVRQQLAATWKPPFRLGLDPSAAGDRLEGTWSSQHVTYDPDDYKIKRIHDPYYRPLILTRAGPRVAQGGRWPQDGP